MPISLSKAKLLSHVGDVQAIYLCGEGDLSALPVTWSVTGDAVTLRSFAEDALTPFTHGVTLSLCREGHATVTATLYAISALCGLAVHLLF